MPTIITTGPQNHITSRPVAVVSPAMKGAEDLNAQLRIREDRQDVRYFKRTL